jgi:hypothetical protein
VIHPKPERIMKYKLLNHLTIENRYLKAQIIELEKQISELKTE